MQCCHTYVPTEGHESCFSVDLSAITFGRGALAEAGEHARALGARRVALFTDPRVGALAHVATVRESLRAAGLDAVLYDRVAVEPTDQSLLEAARFARDGRFDAYVSVGGGSVIDTCKAASLLAAYPADLLAYTNPPVGSGAPVPGALPPHIACPTTSGTGSECTGIAVFDLLSLKAKTAIVSRRLRPTLALVDPTVTATLPGPVVAASGFDVLSHALESYTARPFTARPRPEKPSARPMSQGRNPWSDTGSLEALRLTGRYLVRAVRDASDTEAREQMMYAATLAGIAFGNAGVHLPHGMSYAVAGLVREFVMPGCPPEVPLVPHGVSVVLNAPAVFRFTASACPERHLAGAEALGADVRGALPADAGALLASRLIELMRAAGVPAGLAAVGYGEPDVPALTQGTVVQTRLLGNAPRAVTPDDLAALFRDALSYW